MISLARRIPRLDSVTVTLAIRANGENEGLVLFRIIDVGVLCKEVSVALHTSRGRVGFEGVTQVGCHPAGDLGYAGDHTFL